MRLKTLFPLCREATKIIDGHFELDPFLERSVAIDVLWVRFTTVDRGLLCHYPSVKAVVSATTGQDHYDLDYCERSGIDVLTLKGETEFLQSVYATSEYTIHLILSLLRRSKPARELNGKNVLVVGKGRVGSQVGKILQAHGCMVSYVDKGDDLLAALPHADIVTVHVDLNPSTKLLFCSPEFSAMKPNAYFVNTSRSQVVDLNALHYASGKLAGIGLDAVDSKALGGFSCELICEGHVAGATVESRIKTEVFMARKLVAWKTARTTSSLSGMASRPMVAP